VGGIVSPRGRGLIQSMGDVGVRMWRTAATAYRQRSRDASFQLTEADDELDALATSLVNEGVAEGADPQLAADLALVARFYERLGDHAVNLARRVDEMAAPRRVLHGFTRFRLVPTDDGFFELFEAAAANARDCADELRKLTASLSDLDEHYDEIKGFERRGDEITRDLHRRLDASFITPYDREDIHALAEELDDVVDDMFSAASLIHLVHLGDALPELAELGDVLVAMADEMVGLISSMRTGEGARLRLERIEHLERQGDFVFRRGMSRLFGGEYEALEVIKWKDIVEAMEKSLNAIEDVSDVVESILVKNA
jgi:predicted phosphate transport protein (TIGR00153 family)